MKKMIKFMLIVFSISFFYACSQEDEKLTGENLSKSESGLEEAVDLLVRDGDSIMSIMVSPDSIMPEIPVETKTRGINDEDENFWTNIYAIRGLPVTLQARGGANTPNKFLSTNGKGKEITLAGTAKTNNQKFYLRILPATTGIPYSIYSYADKTPIGVGQYPNNPNNKILFTLKNESEFGHNCSWDFIASSYKGYYAIKSQSYMGQSDPNNIWSIFYHVIEVKNDNKVGYGEYSKKPQQEFLIKPDVSFTIKNVTFDINSATVTEQTPYKISVTEKNTSWDFAEVAITYKERPNEESRFSQNKTIDFNLKTESFARPTVEAGRFVLPRSDTKKDMKYSGTTQNIPKELSFTKNVDAPPRSLIETTAFIRKYVITANYVAKGTYSDREIKLSGTWRGTVYLDSKVSEPTISTRFFNLETGDEIFVTRNTKNKSTK